MAIAPGMRSTARRWSGCGSAGRGGLACGQRRPHGQERRGQQAQGHVPVPGVVAADLVLVQPGIPLGGLDRLLHPQRAPSTRASTAKGCPAGRRPHTRPPRWDPQGGGGPAASGCGHARSGSPAPGGPSPTSAAPAPPPRRSAAASRPPPGWPVSSRAGRRPAPLATSRWSLARMPSTYPIPWPSSQARSQARSQVSGPYTASAATQAAEQPRKHPHRQLRLGRKPDRLGAHRGLAALPVGGPDRRQVQLPVHQRHPPAAHIAC